MSRYTQGDVQKLEQALKDQGHDVDDARVRDVLEMLDSLGRSIDANATLSRKRAEPAKA